MSPICPTQIATTRLRHGAERLVGREKELARLDAAWHDPKTHVVTIVAWGGVGKTALVVDWMARMAADAWRGAERVFDWSFYSQGTSETTSASSDAFVAKALEFFGDPEMAKSAASPWEKGEQLARLVAERKTLLVLDGVEPLQYPPGPVAGKLKDPALEALLKGLAQYNAGLCIVTTREPVTDLAPFRETTAPEWSLEHLSDEAGAQLLFDAGVRRAGSAEVKANDQELKNASREVAGHALTLQLLGPYLAKGYNGDVRKRSLVAFEKADAKVQGGHAFRVMGAYEKWLRGAGEESNKQLAVLHLLGLFDRPADASCLAALRREPAITGLTEPLIGLADEDWNYILSNLRECGFIAPHSDELTLDAHPLVREYFGRRLREKNPDAWREAHRRLYEHLTESTEHQPDTLAGLAPLYQAVAHGCQAGMYDDACQVYEGRIRRQSEQFSFRKLGAFGTDLASLACFFQRPWSEVARVLSEREKSLILSETAFCLRALGRLREALEPMKAGLLIDRQLGDFANACISAENLSEFHLTMGMITEGEEYGNEAVKLANRIKPPNHPRKDLAFSPAFRQMFSLTKVATAQHQAGRFTEAEQNFRSADTKYPIVCGLQWFCFCELLLDMNKFEEAERRARENVDAQTVGLLDSSLDELSMAMVCLRRALRTGKDDFDAQERLNKAVEDLRNAGRQDQLLYGLLARAQYRAWRDEHLDAKSDLAEAWDIAERGSMRLHMADVLLHRGRIFHDKAALAEAAKLINECGYHRRDGELADAQEAAKSW